MVSKKPIKRSVGRPKVRTEMPTAKGQEILDTLKNEGEFKVAGFDLSHRYLGNIIGDIRNLGYSVTSIKVGKFVETYRLDRQ